MSELLKTLCGISATLTAIAGALGAHRRDPADNWCKAKTKDGNRCLKDAAKDGLCATHWRMRASDHVDAPDPAENWCRGELKDGGRCSKDAVKDGLCTAHWRAENRQRPKQQRKQWRPA